MSQTKALVVLGILLVLVVSSAGCTSSDYNPLAPKKVKSKIDVQIVGKSIEVQRGDNITFVALVKNTSDTTYNATLSLGKLPKGFSGNILNTTHELKRSRQKGTLVRIFVGDEASSGDFKVTVKGVFKEKTSQKDSASIKVKVAIPSTGDIRTKDTVEVDYIGFLDNGEIFDTSVGDIGQNTNIPKSKEWKGHGDTYSPLVVTIDTGAVIKGFNDGIKGLEIGQSRTVMVPPSQGYAKMINLTINKTDHIQMVQKMSWNEFASAYGESPAENKVVVDKYWGWSVQVIDLEQSNVTIMINPQLLLNETVHPYGFDSTIESMDSSANGGLGDIVVKHKVVTGVNVTYKAKPGSVIKQTDSTIVIQYNDNADPLSQKNLWFHITVVKINPR